MIILFFFFEFV